MKELSVEEQIYLCKYHDIDTALDKTIHITSDEAEELIRKYKENGLYEQYRNLSDEEYEKIIAKDKLMKKYNKNSEMYEKEKQILEKYNFDKSKRTYKYFLRILFAAKEANRNNKEFILTSILRKIAYDMNEKECNIQNECNRYLIKTYTENTELFKKYQYIQKPSIKEFTLKEINEIIPTEENITLGAEHTQQIELNTNDNTNNIIYHSNMQILIPIIILEEYFYMKRLYRRKRE